MNFANWQTRMWKFAPEVVGNSEFLLHTNILTYIHFDEDIFAGGNCYDAGQYGVRNVQRLSSQFRMQHDKRKETKQQPIWDVEAHRFFPFLAFNPH